MSTFPPPRRLPRRSLHFYSFQIRAAIPTYHDTHAEDSTKWSPAGKFPPSHVLVIPRVNVGRWARHTPSSKLMIGNRARSEGRCDIWAKVRVRPREARGGGDGARRRARCTVPPRWPPQATRWTRVPQPLSIGVPSSVGLYYIMSLAPVDEDAPYRTQTLSSSTNNLSIITSSP